MKTKMAVFVCIYQKSAGLAKGGIQLGFVAKKLFRKTLKNCFAHLSAHCAKLYFAHLQVKREDCLRRVNMKLLICDDEKNEVKRIENIVSEYAKQRMELQIKVQSFSNPFEMLDYIETYGVPDIALLDIYMPGILGIEIARKILERSQDGTDIIFLTTSVDFAVEAFSLHVSDYLSKPFTRERLTAALDRVIEKRRKRRYVPVLCGKEIYRVEAHDILYAESRNHGVEMHLKSGSIIKTRMPLFKLMELLKDVDGFTLVGVSYIVNFIYVQRLHPSMLEIINGDKVPIPRRLRSTLQQQYFDFYTKEAVKQ